MDFDLDLDFCYFYDLLIEYLLCIYFGIPFVLLGCEARGDQMEGLTWLHSYRLLTNEFMHGLKKGASDIVRLPI